MTAALVAAVVVAASGEAATVRLDAAGSGSVYEAIEAAFGRGTVEAPDPTHPAFGRHITVVRDETLGRNVFAFHLHAGVDGDRSSVGDRSRQRNEIKVHDGSPDALKGFAGTTFTYEWKFRLDSGIKVTKMWTHFFQLKPFGGSDDGMPLVTISASRKGDRDSLEIRTCAGAPDGNKYRYPAEHPLADAAGVWLTARCRVTYGEKGSLEITVTRTDGAIVLAYKASPIRMWREGCGFVRPKWGIYRGIAPGLRDEEVRFADFSVSGGR